MYDRDNSSYLFNLNSDWVLDARQRGNKLRFANHSTNANCRAEILMVGCTAELPCAFMARMMQSQGNVGVDEGQNVHVLMIASVDHPHATAFVGTHQSHRQAILASPLPKLLTEGAASTK